MADATQMASRALRRRLARLALRAAGRFAALMVAVSFVSFLLVGLSPIDPVQANVGQAAYATMSAEKREQLEERWDVDRPVLERYASWAAGAVRGDFGDSLRYNAPVASVVAQKVAASALLMATAWVVSGALGFALGLAAGMRRGTPLDRAVKGYCYVLSAAPTFWFGLLLLMVFAVWLGWFPMGFSQPVGASGQASVADLLRHAALPALTLSLSGVANVALHTREKVVDVLEGDYVRFARARGEGSRSVLVHHVLRNVALPALTLQFASVSEIVGGSVLVEQVFSYPGLGQAAVTAGLGGDAPLLVAIALVTAAAVFAGNLAADALYGVVDPRMRGGAAHGARG